MKKITGIDCCKNCPLVLEFFVPYNGKEFKCSHEATYRMIIDNVDVLHPECKLEDDNEISLHIEDAEEVFEILCEIPFEQATMNDNEPPTTRHPSIESLIEQLQRVIDFEEDVKQKNTLLRGIAYSNTNNQKIKEAVRIAKQRFNRRRDQKDYPRRD